MQSDIFSIRDVGQFHNLLPDGSIQDQGDFSDTLKAAKKPIEIDVVALTEFPWKYTFLGDRTIVKSVRRTQWFSSSPRGVFHVPPRHGNKMDSAINIAGLLQAALKKEISGYIVGKKNIGILLSGGMDSRMVAGILKSIQAEKHDLNVTVFCWGMTSTRDPVYSERIATMYGWAFEYFDITPQLLKRNITICAKEGCFYSPSHLHAMPDVAQRASDLGMDCILAASYGDSIGRSEYSGRKVTELPAMKDKIQNVFGLINDAVYEQCKAESIAEIDRYHDLYRENEDWAENELDYQLHYMRNQLGTCMSLISKRVPLIQCFCSKEIVELMWSYHPDCRTDKIYLHMLKNIDPQLFEIPWARTGKRYLMDNDVPDDLSRSFHCYGKWAREDLRCYIDELVCDGRLQRLNVFNTYQIRLLNRFNRVFTPVNSYHNLDEIILWLASVSIFLREIDCVYPASYNQANSRHPSILGSTKLLYRYKGNIARKLKSVFSLSKQAAG